MERIDIKNSWPEIIGVEISGRYDWVAYYLNQKTWQRYSRTWLPIDIDEVCRPWRIYKVEFYDKRWTDFKILSSREDKDGTRA